MVTEGAEFLALTHPNHPTGSTISSEELQAAVDICQSAGVRLVSDETYGLMTEGEPLPPAACVDPTAVSLSTMSKTFGLPGHSHRVDRHPRRQSDASAARRP